VGPGACGACPPTPLTTGGCSAFTTAMKLLSQTAPSPPPNPNPGPLPPPPAGQLHLLWRRGVQPRRGGQRRRQAAAPRCCSPRALPLCRERGGGRHGAGPLGPRVPPEQEAG
jgi:hypothetical protein